MKVIFLDIDGVLNCSTSTKRYHGTPFVDDDKLKLLAEIVSKTDAKLVLSSTWRFGLLYPDSIFAGDVIALQKELYRFSLKLFSYTPRLPDKQRGDEIQAWLASHTGVESFVILDDDSDMADIKEYLVKTTWEHGLQREHVEKAINILNLKD